MCGTYCFKIKWYSFWLNLNRLPFDCLQWKLYKLYNQRNNLFCWFIELHLQIWLWIFSDTQTLVNESNKSAPVIVSQTPQNQTDAQTSNPFQCKQDRGKALRQVVAAFIVNLGTINTGLVFGFSAVVIPQLKRDDSIIPITDSEASWIGKFSTCAVTYYYYWDVGIHDSLNLFKLFPKRI